MIFENIKEKIDNITGFLMAGQERWLFETAKSLPDNSIILEIGCFLGKSTNCLAFGCAGTNKRVFAIDAFEKHFEFENFYKTWEDTLEKNGLLKYVFPLVGYSQDIAKIWEYPIDFLFVDGSHLYKDVLADFLNFFPFVVKGGIVAFHDVENNHADVVRVWYENAKELLLSVGSCKSIAFGKKAKEIGE